MKPNLISDLVHKGNAFCVMPAYILSMEHKSKQPRIALAQDYSKKNKDVKMAVRCQSGNPFKGSFFSLAY